MSKTFRLWGIQLDTYPLRYINLFPYLSAITIVADEPVAVPGSDQKVCPPEGRWYQLALFGRLFGLTVPTTKSKRAWNLGIRGPHWSRSKKKWHIPKGK